jgi:antitoxin VapB
MSEVTRSREDTMDDNRHVKLTRHGEHQVVEIPRDMEMKGSEVIVHKEGDRLVIEPVPGRSLKEILAALKPICERIPEIEDSPPRPAKL